MKAEIETYDDAADDAADDGPAYEEDDGPLTDEQLTKIRELSGVSQEVTDDFKTLF